MKSRQARALLGKAFLGVLVADAYAAYNGTHPQDRQSRLSHPSRKAKELVQDCEPDRARPGPTGL